MKQNYVVNKNGKRVGNRIVKFMLALALLALLVACGAGPQSAVEPAAVYVEPAISAAGTAARYGDGVQRVSFTRGATEIALQGISSGQAQTKVVFWGTAGQALSVSVTSPQGSIPFQLEGADYGQVYTQLRDGKTSWQGTLSMSQDYLLTIDNADLPAEYTVELAVVGG